MWAVDPPSETNLSSVCHDPRRLPCKWPPLLAEVLKNEFRPHPRQTIWSCRGASTPNGANLSTPDITGQSTKYALNRIYRLSNHIKPADKTARKKRPIFQRFYPSVISVQILAAPTPFEVVCQRLYPAVISVRENRSTHEPMTLALATSL